MIALRLLFILKHDCLRLNLLSWRSEDLCRVFIWFSCLGLVLTRLLFIVLFLESIIIIDGLFSCCVPAHPFSKRTIRSLNLWIVSSLSASFFSIADICALNNRISFACCCTKAFSSSMPSLVSVKYSDFKKEVCTSSKRSTESVHLAIMRPVLRCPCMFYFHSLLITLRHVKSS